MASVRRLVYFLRTRYICCFPPPTVLLRFYLKSTLLSLKIELQIANSFLKTDFCLQFYWIPFQENQCQSSKSDASYRPPAG
jgi:hypothetical protein